ncbi:MAG: hypothetical protein ABW321_24055 [Polyangiales bacterium]
MRARRIRRRKQQEGAVLVEWVIVAASFCLILACMFCVQRYCVLHMRHLDAARARAWTSSMNGCAAGTPDIGDVGDSLKNQELPPFAEQMLPERRTAQSSFTLQGSGLPAALVGIGGLREVRFICNPLPSQEIPTSNIRDWLEEYF